MMGVISKVNDQQKITGRAKNQIEYVITIYAVIFKGRKFCGFCCKLVEREILILEKKQWLKRKHCIRLTDQRKLNRENPYRLVFHEIQDPQKSPRIRYNIIARGALV